MADRASGAAWRRRQRRLRSWWRHVQQTVAAVLATVTHRSHSKVGTANDAPRGQETVNSTRVGPAEYHELSSDDGRPTGGERPAALLEPLPRVKVQRHAGIGHEIVQNLDVPVPQMVEQLPNIVQFFAALSPVPEQVMEVPKILPDDVPMRTAVRDAQLVEQLVEVPTIISYSSLLLLQRIMEQNVDIPVVGGSGAGGGFSGFLPGQHFSMPAEQIVDNPAPWLGFGGGLQGLQFNSFFGADRRVPRSRWRSSRFSTSPGFRSVFFGFSWTRWWRGFSHFSPDEKARHYLRTLGRHCLRTRAHGRWRLMACRWRSRKRRSRSRMRRREVEEVASSTWSATWDPTVQRFCWWLAAAEALSSATPPGGLRGTLVDVPVTMLDKFQQSVQMTVVVSL